MSHALPTLLVQVPVEYSPPGDLRVCARKKKELDDSQDQSGGYWSDIESTFKLLMLKPSYKYQMSDP